MDNAIFARYILFCSHIHPVLLDLWHLFMAEASEYFTSYTQFLFGSDKHTLRTTTITSTSISQKQKRKAHHNASAVFTKPNKNQNVTLYRMCVCVWLWITMYGNSNNKICFYYIFHNKITLFPANILTNSIYIRSYGRVLFVSVRILKSYTVLSESFFTLLANLCCYCDSSIRDLASPLIYTIYIYVTTEKRVHIVNMCENKCE